MGGQRNAGHRAGHGGAALSRRPRRARRRGRLRTFRSGGRVSPRISTAPVRLVGTGRRAINHQPVNAAGHEDGDVGLADQNGGSTRTDYQHAGAGDDDQGHRPLPGGGGQEATPHMRYQGQTAGPATTTTIRARPRRGTMFDARTLLASQTVSPTATRAQQPWVTEMALVCRTSSFRRWRTWKPKCPDGHARGGQIS